MYTNLANPVTSGLKLSPGTLRGTVGGATDATDATDVAGATSAAGSTAVDAIRCRNACLATVTPPFEPWRFPNNALLIQFHGTQIL